MIICVGGSCSYHVKTLKFYYITQSKPNTNVTCVRNINSNATNY